MRQFPNQTYAGPTIDDHTLLARLPNQLARLLQELNGFVALAEIDDVEALGCDFDGFISRAIADPVEFLGLEPLIQFRREGGTATRSSLLGRAG
jgi:hypothetical protein